MHKAPRLFHIRTLALLISAILCELVIAAPAIVEHWSFRPPAALTPPGDSTGWSRTPIDTFVRAQLSERNVQPAPEADPRTLIRRLFLDLTGLPPTPDEVQRFVDDAAPNAYDRLVDSLLTSPHYGERWGRHWLDLARYADSAGYEADPARPAWIYREWVINAMNRNQPFDEFVIEQLAGDLLPAPKLDQVIATGFHGVGPYTAGLRHLNVMNRVTTTSAVFLGLTLECAQCHDHKTDPVSQRNYYEFFAFFDEARLLNLEVELPDEPESTRAKRLELAKMRTTFEQREKSLADSLNSWIAKLNDELIATLSRRAREALKKPASKRSDQELQNILRARCKLDEVHTELKKELTEREKEFSAVTATPVMKRRPKVTRIFNQGNHATPGDIVKPDVPGFLPPLSRTDAESADRLDLARWLVSPDNPLTARVTVNRIWQRYFGLGLVETETDLGIQTPPPTHPALLDWLAVEFMQSGWDLKHIHRLIVGTSTYRQSSRMRPELTDADPRNRWLARQSRIRLESEIIRDGFLEASGLLTHRIGGPSVYPYQPAGLNDFQGLTKKWVESPGAEKYRRGMYTWLWRKDAYPLLVLFDLPDSDVPCGRRERSTTPVQALSLLNDPGLVECARSLGARVIRESSQDVNHRLDYLFTVCFGRPTQPDEREVLLELLATERAQFEKDPDDVARIAGDAQPDGASAIEQALWTIAARVVLNLDEFITRE
jgi:hypothetical protein